MKFAAKTKSKAAFLLLCSLFSVTSAGDPDYDNDVERKFDYANSFLAGFKS